jgi:hypothetical protein
VVLFVVEAVSDNRFTVAATLERPMPCGTCSGYAAIVDIDGDGKREIALGTDMGLSIYRNTADNTWEEIWSFNDSSSFLFFYFGAGDHDRDGKAELVLAKLPSFGSTAVFEIDPADAADQDMDGTADAADNCQAVVNPGQEDADLDGLGDACDNCIWGPNPDQGPAPFGQTVLARNSVMFFWPLAVDIEWVRGDLGGVGSYVVDLTGSLALATNLVDTTLPPAGTGLYYLLKPDCPLGAGSR